MDYSVSYLLHRFIFENLSDCYNSIIENNTFSIIKYASVYHNKKQNLYKKWTFANMLRSSGYGFIDTSCITNFPHHSDHDEQGSSFVVLGLDIDLARFISEKVGSNDFMFYEPSYDQQILHVDMRAKIEQFVIKSVVLDKITQDEIDFCKNKYKDYVNDTSKWSYNYSRKNRDLLKNLVDSYAYKFADPSLEFAAEVYHENDENEKNYCVFGFSEYVKYMPSTFVVRHDDFANSFIVSKLNIYLPLTAI